MGVSVRPVKLVDRQGSDFCDGLFHLGRLLAGADGLCVLARAEFALDLDVRALGECRRELAQLSPRSDARWFAIDVRRTRGPSSCAWWPVKAPLRRRFGGRVLTSASWPRNPMSVTRF